MAGPKQLKHLVTAFPLYLIVFCIQAPLSVAEVYSYYDRYSALPAMALLLAVGLLLFLLFKLVFRHTQFAGLIALAAVMVLFPRATKAVPPYLAIAGIGFAIPLLRFLKDRLRISRETFRIPGNFTFIANVAAGAMLAGIGLQAAYAAYLVRGKAVAVADKLYAALPAPPTATPRPGLPTIVHIVLDGYSRADVLRDLYGFDNTPFLEALKQRGFRIADKARTPFNQTLFVMNAVFSLGASTAAPSEIVGEDPAKIRALLSGGVERGGVARILRALGYEMQSTPSTYLPLQWSDVVDASGDPVSHFALPGTYLLTFDLLRSFPPLRTLSQTLLGPSIDIDAINYRNLKEVPKRRFQVPEDRPAFIYQHILAPHPPFNITADGRRRPLARVDATLNDGFHFIRGREARRARYREGYVEKLRYINGAVLEQIDGLKRSLSGPLVIVLHGDHGGGLHMYQNNLALTCLSERYSPLLAVYATDERISAAVTSDFDLVNIYRVILGSVLNADLPTLPTNSTYVSWTLENAVRLRSAELSAPCPAARKSWTAERPGPGSAPAATPPTAQPAGR